MRFFRRRHGQDEHGLGPILSGPESLTSFPRAGARPGRYHSYAAAETAVREPPARGDHSAYLESPFHAHDHGRAKRIHRPDKGGRFFVEVGMYDVVSVEVAKSPSGHPYLKTELDADTPDQLLFLPECR